MRVPVDIVLHKQSKAMELVYEEGTRYLLPYEFLRVLSPSAEVQGHSPEEAVLQVGKRDVTIVGVEPVGTYALRLVFSDGHDSGFYEWDYFVELGENKETYWQDYLAKLAAVGASRDPEGPRNEPFKPKPKKACGR